MPTKDINKPIEERLFEITLFLTMITFLTWSVIGIWSDYTWTIQGVYLFSVLFYAALYVVVKREAPLPPFQPYTTLLPSF